MLKISLIDKSEKVSCVRFGMNTLLGSMKKHNIEIRRINFFTQLAADEDTCIMVGLTTDYLIGKVLREENIIDIHKPESVLIKSCSTPDGKVLVIAGSDNVGLMYALLEVSDQVEAYGGEILNKDFNTVESPDNASRSVSRFLMSRRDDSWFYSDEFWNYYFKQLAKNRFNNFVLILGFDTGYMSPPYTFFLDVPGYPDVATLDVSGADRKRNLECLRNIGRLCHEYGITFELGIWQQIPWTTKDNIVAEISKNHSKPWEARQVNLVSGLPSDEGELSDFCAKGLKELLTMCPEIDILQLRVNFEAGIGTQETNNNFWKMLVKSVSEVDRDIELKLRAKGLTDEIAQYAMEIGVHLTIPTKYWCEHVALPYHMNVYRTEEMKRLENQNMNRRYSYADLLRKPHFYDITYRLWNYGTSTIFLWGDPDYVKRFSQSISDAQAKGFEITAPLSLKGGQISIPGDEWALFSDESLIHFKYEDERYWAWYLFFGRQGYNKNTESQVWSREFKKHFGDYSKYMEAAYSSASKILTFITTIHFPVHPSLQYWPELSTGGALFGEHNYNTHFDKITYGQALPSDEGLFYGIEEYVTDLRNGKLKGKYTPLQSREWLTLFADKTKEAIDSAIAAGLDTSSAEIKATLLDMNMLVNLAYYHSEKILSAMNLAYYNATQDKKYINDCLCYMLKAKGYWQSLCDLGSAYHHDLQFSASHGDACARSKHWKDRMPELERDIAKLYELLGSNELQKEESVYSVGESAGYFKSDVPETIKEGTDMVVHVRACQLIKHKNGMKMHYRHMNHLEGYFIELDMEETSDGYMAVIPKEYVTYEWDLMVYFTTVESDSRVFIYPGIYNLEHSAPYHIVHTTR